VFAAVGGIGLMVVRRQGATARGGDWAELREALLGWLPRRKRRA
jgi:hypothetical protein